MTTLQPGPPPESIEFLFQSYDAMKLAAERVLVFFTFEEQPDPVISSRFPETEEMRLGIEKNRTVVHDMTYLFQLTREGVSTPSIMVYIGRPWRTRQRSSRLRFDSIGFYRILGIQTSNLIKKLRDMGHTEATIVLPGRFSPKNFKKDRRFEHEEEAFVRTITESIVTANAPDTYLTAPRPRIARICFTHFGNHEQVVSHFFERAVRSGVEVGSAVAEARRLTLTPPGDKTPLRLAGLLTKTKVELRSVVSPQWRRIKNHAYGPRVTASILYGTEGLRKAGFGLIAAVGGASKHEPCLLKLHYRPKKSGKPVKKIALIGKGVIFDTGGLNLKTDGTMQRMHYDMAGAATVAAVFRLAVEREVSCEIVALLPLVENAIGPGAVRAGDIVRAYDGQTVEITDTDSEGRLILADALAYSEKHVRPDAVVTAATLCDMGDFGPDFLKVMVTNRALERRARLAEGRAAEKIVLFPLFEHFDTVVDLFGGTVSDLVNESGYHYHTGMIFIGRFFRHDPPTPWLYLDVASVFETDADSDGAGPGFGVRFLWQFVRQF